MPATKLIIPTPNLPQPPAEADELLEWAKTLVSELDHYFSALTDHLADHRLIGRVDKQIIIDGFTIQPSQVFVDLYAAAGATSNLLNAIKDGVDGQWMVVTNRGPGIVIIKDGARTHLGGDKTLGPNDTLAVRWTGELWVIF